MPVGVALADKACSAKAAFFSAIISAARAAFFSAVSFGPL